MFLLMEHVPHMLHTAFDVHQLHSFSNENKKAALPANGVFLAQRVTWLTHKERMLFTRQRHDTY